MTWLMLVLDKVQELPYLGDVLISFSKSWMTLSGLPNISSIIFGLIIILLVVFEPLGLFGFWIRTKIYWKTWPF
jgi:branched-chain amino acid transport system permease protein